jgi:DeoR/GlpR family transcriptional regulator of sugar metabolism
MLAHSCERFMFLSDCGARLWKNGQPPARRARLKVARIVLKSRNPLARRQNIREVLNREGVLSIDELCRRVGASPATLRRDLNQLEKEGSIERSRGGAAPRYQHPAEAAIAQREKLYAAEKATIARLAMDFVRPGDTVFLNDGSTTLALARLLARTQMELFVVTSGLNVAIALSKNENLQICVLGGMLRAKTLAAEGEFTLKTLSYLSADVAFISGDSFGAEQGMNFLYPGDATTSAAMLARARRKIALVVSAKTEWKTRIKAADIETFDVVIADRATPKLAADCEAADIRLVTPGPAPEHEVSALLPGASAETV